MYGKMILPLLGSSPNVWNTCMFFFQFVLLLGYLYAHISISLLGIKKQAIFHLLFLLLPLFFLPILIPKNWEPSLDINPIPSILLLMISTIGFPFFMISASAPMLQKWFSNTSHILSKDPYFLYVASNVGSFIGLFSYPFIIEPNFKLADQSIKWSMGYILLILLTAFCVFTMFKMWFPSKNLIDNSAEEIKKESSTNPFKWTLLSFIPSSLMLSITTYITTDIAAFPLFWVIPLGIYLLSFIITFSKKEIISHAFIVKIFLITVLPIIIFILSGPLNSIWITLLAHLLTLFMCSMVCNGELVKSRPQVKYLTEFYLWISFGGFLGGAFNALIAPIIFKSILEYPIAIILACLVLPREHLTRNKWSNLLDYAFPITLGLFIYIIKLSFNAIDIKSALLQNLLLFTIPALFCFCFIKRPIRFGLGVAAFFFVSNFNIGGKSVDVYSKRSFFGTHRVTINTENNLRYLIHGRTVHGAQNVNQKRNPEPLTYYHLESPVGNLFMSISDIDENYKIAAIGLGVGSIAAYSKPKQEWTFYEIDPVVKKIAENKNYFTFLENCKAKYSIILGDGRLSIKKAKDSYYDLLVLDAFSSDAIPTHLITKEAIKTYLDKLSQKGILAFHISNKYIALKPVLENIALNMGLVSYFQADTNLKEEEGKKGKSASLWIVMARKKDYLGSIVSDKRWKMPIQTKYKDIWTDDFSNIVSVINWGGLKKVKETNQ